MSAIASFDSPSAIADPKLQVALERAFEQVNSVVLGKQQQVRLAFTCLLAGGHLLIEDLPGVGKTTLAHVLAASLDLSFQRVQFTSDLLPSDIIGLSMYERERGEFRFHPGPLFAQLVLADEINRATPKTQSALLEAMAEQQVTVDGVTHRLPSPFFVVATQNPLDLAGTYLLPDSQLDRFMLRINLEYPSREAERLLLMASDRRELIASILPQITSEQILELRNIVKKVLVSPALVDYIQALLAASREHPEIRVGLSPRAGLALLNATRAYALLAGRSYSLPEDVQAVFVATAAHRLIPGSTSTVGRESLANALLNKVSVGSDAF